VGYSRHIYDTKILILRAALRPKDRPNFRHSAPLHLRPPAVAVSDIRQRMLTQAVAVFGPLKRAKMQHLCNIIMPRMTLNG